MALAAGLVGLLLLVAISPTVQTWVAQSALSGRSEFQGTVESVSAGFGEVAVDNLRLQAGATVLTLPSLQAKLPLTAAVIGRQLIIHSLVATGWTLDLSHTSTGPAAGPPAAPASPQGGLLGHSDAAAIEVLAAALGGVLRGQRIPFDASVDGVSLEGDILFSTAAGNPPQQMHVVITGGGLRAGHEGTFALQGAVTAPGSGFSALSANGTVTVAMGRNGTVDRVEVKADVSGQGLLAQESMTVTIAAVGPSVGGGPSCTVAIGQGGRNMVTVVASPPDAAQRIKGTWSLDLRDPDLAPFFPDHPLPSFSAAGAGRFDADAALEAIHVVGSLKSTESHLDVLSPALGRLGRVTLDSSFDVTQRGTSLRVEKASATLGTGKPAVTVATRVPFDIDEATGSVTLSGAPGDWLHASVTALPLAWLSGPWDHLGLTGGDVTGAFDVRAAGNHFTLRPEGPLEAAGFTAVNAGTTLVRGIDLSIMLSADWDATQWRVRCDPLLLDSGNRRLGTLIATVSHEAGSDKAVAATVKWTADLEALAAAKAVPAMTWSEGRSASGDFTATLGEPTGVDGSIRLDGHAAGDSVTSDFHADLYSDGELSLKAPLVFGSGQEASDLLIDGTWAPDAGGARIDAKLTGKRVSVAALRLLGAPLAALSAGPGADRTPAGGADRIPFWGAWVGQIEVAFERLRTEDVQYYDVAGSFDVDHGSIRLTDGNAGLQDHGLKNVKGALTFDPAAAVPYSLKATDDDDAIDVAKLFAPKDTGELPLLEGHFTISQALIGSGMNLSDLIGRTQVDYRLASTGGIMRFLGANVAASLPEDAASPVSDTVGSAASFVVGSVFGLKKYSIGKDTTTLGKNTEAVLDFVLDAAEIGFDQASVHAVRGADGTLHILDVEMASPDETVKGTGEIADAPGVALMKRPLSVDLRLAFRGKPARLLATAGLVTLPRDPAAFAPLAQPVRFGGTLEHIDGGAWNDLLVKAATRKPDPAKAPAPPAKP